MRYLAGFTFVILALSACGGPGSVPSGPQSGGDVRALGSPRDLSKKAGERLFVSDAGSGDVYVYDAPSLKLFTILQGFARPQGECADDKGDVFVTDGSAAVIYELSYSGSMKAQLVDSTGYPDGCAWDSKSGNLAVMNYIGKESQAGAILVFHHASGSPNTYTNPHQFYYSFGGYDSKGDLFVDGSTDTGKFVLSELPANAGAAKTIGLKGGHVYSPGMVQWGPGSQYLDVGDQNCANSATSCLYQMTVSGKTASVKAKMSLQNYKGTPVCDLVQGIIAGGVLYGSDNDYCGYAPNAAYGWSYPAGGAPKTYAKETATTPFGAAIAANGARSPDLNYKKLDLLYLASGSGDVVIYTYWQKTLVRKLTGFSKPEGECVNKKNDVYVTDAGNDDIVEYAHDGKTPLRAIKESPYVPYGCAVDPGTGDLAIANASGGSGGQGNVAVYPGASGQPTIYTDATVANFTECAYDDRGNLLVSNGEFPNSRYSLFAWLPKGSGKLVNITIPGPSKSWTWEDVQGLQWDGRYFVVNFYGLYRVAISNDEGYYVGQTGFDGEELYGPFAVYNKNPKKQATQFASAYIDDDQNYDAVYYYNYPQGGESSGYLTTGISEPNGLVVSLGKDS